MDIYSYLNSRDVAAYCREINHSFNAVEQAFIINDCRHISVEEKLRLYQEITDTLPDEMMSEKAPYFLCYHDDMPDSFHSVLSEYVRTLRAALEQYFIPEKDAVYSIILKNSVWEDAYESQMLHFTFEKAKKELLAKFDEYEIEDAAQKNLGYITKRHIGSEQYERVVISSDGVIVSFLESTCGLLDLFDDIWVQIPVPFKKGDLLCCINEFGWQNPAAPSYEVMVLSNVCYQNRSEEQLKQLLRSYSSMDMTAFGYWLEKNGKIYCECTHEYHNLEYYRGEIKGDLRLLKALSAHTKGEIDTEMLLFVFDAVQREHAMKETFPGWDFEKRYYAKAGIADLFVKRELCKMVDKGVTKMMRGVFWLIDGKLHAFPFDGSYPEGTAKSGVTYNHKKLWELVKPKGCNHPFDWYPRGRVELTDRDQAVIYMSSHIDEDMVYQIMDKFGITSEPIIRYDYSRHYHCHLDEEEEK